MADSAPNGKSKNAEFIEDLMKDDNDSASEDSQVNSRTANFIKKYNLPDRFTILPDRVIKDLSSVFAKAFEVRDLKQKEDLYAIILPNTIPIRFRTVQQLKMFFSPNFANVLESGFTDFARGEHGSFAAILEKPRGRKLSDVLSELKETVGELKPPLKLLLPEEFIATEIVGPINEVLKLFNEVGVCHGKINHENVYIGSFEEPKVMLGECISEPCGFAQYSQYETTDRAQAMPLGKGNSSIAADYFSLGTLVLYCLFGEIPGSAMDQTEFLTQRLIKGTYNAFLGTMELPPRITDLLRGLLTDNTQERWGYDQVYNWVKGKKYNLIRPKLRKECVRNYDFLGKTHATKKHLAQTYFQNWDDAALDMKGNRLSKWLELSVNDKDMADSVSALAGINASKGKSRNEDDELVAKSLIVLDPSAPIRYRNVSVHIDGFGTVLANAWLHQNQSEINTFSEIIKLNLVDFKAVHDTESQKVDRWVVQRLQGYIKLKSLGFGIERCLYDLNPSLPCQSPMLQSQYIIEINQLLYFLNDNASKLSANDPVDRHVAAFLASKLELSQEIKLKMMRHMRDDRAKTQLIKLALLAFAQRKSNAGKLTGLANWIVGKIKFVVDSLHGKKNKKELNAEIKALAEAGNLEGILSLIINSDLFAKDADAFSNAQREYGLYENELKLIKARHSISMSKDSHYLLGLYLAKLIGMMAFVIILFCMML